MGEIVLNEFVSVEGFVDSSYSHNQSDIAGTKESTNSFGIDQVEIDWLFSFGNVSAQVDLEYEEGVNGTNVEQAFVNYALTNGDVVTAGRYASMLGFEAFEPTGLYQFSLAYDFSGILGDANTLIQAITGANAAPAGITTSNIATEVGNLAAQNYVQGVKYTRTTETTFFGISLQDQSFGNDGDRLGGDNDAQQGIDSSYAVEVAGSMDLGNGFNVFAGGSFEDAESGDNQLINTYVTYETGAWLFAAEVNVSESEDVALNVGTNLLNGLQNTVTGDVDGLGYMLMANYAYSDVASVTARISSQDFDASGVDLEMFKYTLAHLYAFSDNLALCVEVSQSDIDLDIDGILDEDGDNLGFAVELLFSF